MGPRARLAALGAVAVLVSAVLALASPIGADYAVAGPDAAGPAVDALVRGDLSAYAAHQPAQGPVSILLRAPFAALAPAGDQLARYRLGVFPCVLALALAALAVGAAMQRRGKRPWEAWAVAALLLLAPVMRAALTWGHPEELLATALVLGSALATGSGAVVAGGAAAGLAVATKSWALIGLVPLALLAGRRAWRWVAAAAVTCALLVGPLVAANPGAFGRAGRTASEAPLVHPADVWWMASQRHVTISDGPQVRRVHAPAQPTLVRNGVRPALVAITALLALLVARRRRPTLDSALIVLALVMLLRCVLDPGDNGYYHVPFTATVIAWGALFGRRPLLIAAAAVAATATVPGPLGPHRDLVNLLYLAWALPVTALLAWQALKRATARSTAA